MSAINCINTRDAAHIVTDACWYDTEGVVLKIGPKQFSLPHLPAVIATRGSGYAPPIFGHEFGTRFATFDELVEGVEEATVDVHNAYLGMFEECGNPDVEIIIAGYSASRGSCAAYMIKTAELDDATRREADRLNIVVPEAFQLLALPGVTMGPQIEAEALREAGLHFDLTRDDCAALHAKAITLLELQREICVSYAEGMPMIHGVGGFAQIGTVTKEGVQQSILHRWPDKLGVEIEPEEIDWAARRGTAQVDAMAGMSKMQREMFQRRQKKLQRRAA